MIWYPVCELYDLLPITNSSLYCLVIEPVARSHNFFKILTVVSRFPMDLNVCLKTQTIHYTSLTRIHTL